MPFTTIFTWILSTASLALIGLIIYKQIAQQRFFDKLVGQLEERNRNNELSLSEFKQQMLVNKDSFSQQLQQFQDKLLLEFQQYRQSFDQHQFNSLTALQTSITQSMTEIRSQVTESLQNNTRILSQRVDTLTEKTQQQLQEISGQVDKRLSDGFEKTTATFADILKRLALIDEAQKKITELSSNVVSLQEVLSDKRSRGAFGEVQLNGLISNMLPNEHFALQHTLSTGKRVDCILFLPPPSGNICIDAKFPLENYRKLTDISLSETERKNAENQFKQDIRKHVQDIAQKYIISNETADGAIMFLPAEAIFAEIHGHYPELVEEAQRLRVWLVSPTTLMAVLTTTRAVLKDAATRQQIHLIQKYLSELAKDFERFQHRMNNLAKHIDQAQADVKDVHISAKKISTRFTKIEQVELNEHLELELTDA